ncbi:MAG: ATP-binding cassette domain-containing protein [Pseudomonadota bacterium]|nr:ATP-binding cassette domain-containing protein [Pseudomonadota bacterium]
MPQLRLKQFSPLILEPLDLVVDEGETVTLSGPSGSGKSQLLRAIADLDPHNGTAWIGDSAADKMPAPQWRRKVGYLPADSSWWEELVGVHFSETPELDALGLTEAILHSSVAHISSGERQRLAVLRMLQQQPQILLLDEPTANLDPHHTLLVEEWILKYQQHNGAPILWVSHDPEQRLRVGKRHFEIHDKKVVQT